MTITPFAWRDEYAVNTTTASSQADPKVAVLANGNYVIIWRDGSQFSGPNNLDIRGQVYDRFGDPINGEFVANTTVLGQQREPNVVALADGGFVVTYNDNSSLMGQAYDDAGTAVGTEFAVNLSSIPTIVFPTIAPLENGGFIATWTEFGFGGDNNIHARRFASDGTPIDASDIVVTPNSSGDQSFSDVTALVQDLFVVVWEDGGDILGSRFDAAGNPQSTFQINFLSVTDNALPKVTTLANDNFLVTWGSPSGIYARIYQPNGLPVGNDFLLVSSVVGQGISFVEAEALPDGGFLLTWTASGLPGGGTGHRDVVAQRFDGSGTAIGTQLTVHRASTEDQNSASVAITQDGRAILVWTDGEATTDDGEPSGIRSQILSPTGGTAAGDGTAQQLFGDGEDNVIHGLGGNDTLHGLDGNDSLQGGGGNDTLNGGDDDDYLVGGGGVDTFDGGNGVDTIDYRTTSLAATVNTGPGTTQFTPTIIEGFSNVERFLMGAGDDTLIGNGISFFDGGDGTDTIDYSGVTTGITLDLRTQTADFGGGQIETFANIETFILGSAGDLIIGDENPNHLEGGGGDDFLNGLGGDDVMIGGTGSDGYQVSEIGDVIIENAGEGNDDAITATVSFTNVANVERLILGGFSSINATGLDGQRDKLFGNAGNNILDGRGGDDVLEGGAGNDMLIGGLGVDSYDGGDDVDTIDYTDNDENGTIDLTQRTAQFSDGLFETFSNVENFLMGPGNDSVTGDNENNLFDGGDGRDTLIGGDGDDTLIGGEDDDDMFGGIGNDTYHVDNIADAVVEDGGSTAGISDTIRTTISFTLPFNVEVLILEGSANLDGTGRSGSHDETLTGNIGNNTLDGRGGVDDIDGGGGDDTLVGGGGADMLEGGIGNDTASYEGSAVGVVVNLDIGNGTGAGQLGDADGDMLTGIENLTGSAERDFLFGDAGENILVGGEGFDVLQGYGGNDVYEVDNSMDAVIEEAGGGFDNVFSSVDYIIDSAQEIESAILTGSTATVLRGDDSGNQLFGNDAVNVIDGRGGTDFMLGQGGADIFQINLEPGAVDVVGDFSKAEGDRMAFTGFNAATTFVNQASATSFEVRDTKGTADLADDTVQTFQLWDSYDPANPQYTQGALVFGVDYYFG